MLIALFVAAALQTSSAQASEDRQDPPGFWERDALFGDWGGVRSSLADQGVTTTLAFTGEVLGATSGGTDRDRGSGLLLDWVVDSNLSTLLGWTGASARINPLWLAGDEISANLGDLTKVSNIAGRGGVRVFEFWLQQSVADNLASLRAGILAADQEFAITGSALLYYNSVFGGPVFLTPNLPWPIYPLGALGARVRVDPDASTYVQVGVYEGSPGTEADNRSGLNVDLSTDEGVFVIGEAGWKSGGELPFLLKAGAYYHSGDVAASRSGVAGAYALIERKLCRPGSFPGMVDAFVRVGFAQDDKSLVSFGVDAGVNVTGLLSFRPEDILGLGVIYGRISRHYAQTQTHPSIWGYEAVIEATYKIVITPAWSLQPDVQYIVHPGGTTAETNATVIGLRVDVNF